jgi:hypothetical protein
MNKLWTDKAAQALLIYNNRISYSIAGTKPMNLNIFKDIIKEKHSI